MKTPVRTTALCPTPYAELNSVLSILVEGIVAVLGERLVSVCLQGSFAVGDFDENSDVDFIVATSELLDVEAVGALQSLHARVFDLDCQWAQHLEGSYFPADVLRSCARRGEELWYLDNGSRALIRSKHCNTAVVRQTVRERGIRLAAAEPATLIDPIPVDLLRDEIRVTMCGWARDILARPEPYRNRFYQGFIVLQYCRMWCDWTTGTIGSKRRGAEWAKTRLDASWADLIDRAWDTRPNPAVSVRQEADGRDFERSLQLMMLIVESVQVRAS
jgi:predicted nucleotidyltransferase